MGAKGKILRIVEDKVYIYFRGYENEMLQCDNWFGAIEENCCVINSSYLIEGLSMGNLEVLPRDEANRDWQKYLSERTKQL